jgi:hypothetical protein
MSLKRNDIVTEYPNPGYVFYGRISRVFPDNTVEVLTCGRHIKTYHQDQLKKEDYTGYWDNDWSDLRRKFPVFIRMPSLRKLKQRCAYYDKTVWKKYRKDSD